MALTLEQILQKFNTGLFEQAQSDVQSYQPKNKKEEQRLAIISTAIMVRTGKVDEGLAQIESLWHDESMRNAELYNLKGIALRAKNKLQEAIEIFEEGFSKYADSIDLAHNLSLTATDLAQYTKGTEYAKKALALNPKFKEALKNLARIYITVRDVKNAQVVFKQLRAINETGIDVLVGEGALDLIGNNPEEASKKFKKALKINPKAGPALANLGICYKFMGDYHNAKKYLEQACIYEPDQIEHPWNLSIVKLALGEFEQGWRDYEVRYDTRRIATDRVVMPNTPVPMLKPGDSVKGKTLVILQEQGFGDTFQFFRFTEQLKAEGAAEIIAIVSKDLMGVIKTIPWIDRVQNEMKATDRLPDFWVFAMSLPYRYQLKTVDDVPYPSQYMKLERHKKEQWDQRFEEFTKKIRIGLIWAGRETHSNDENRSMELKTFNRLAKYQDRVDFFSLQKGKKQDQGSGIDWNITKLGDELKDFSDTAAVFSNLDLLISIDSGPIHLAGAMGMPVWTLIPQIFDFRWLVDREDTPWYPSMKLFRQKKGESWEHVVERVDLQLASFIQNYQGRWQPDVIESLPQEPHSPMKAGVGNYLQIAFQYHQQQELVRAINAYQKVLQYEPRHPDAIRNLAAAYRARGQKEQAMCIYQKAVLDGSADSLLYSNYANLLIECQEDRLASEILDKALLLNPDNQAAKQTKIQLAQKSPSKSAGTNQPILGQKPIEEMFKEIWGFTFGDQLLKAKESLAKLLEFGPITAEKCIMAAIVHQECEEFELAKQYYEKAIQLRPDFPETYINQAVLFAKLLDYSSAVAAVNRTIELNPDHAEAHFHKSLYLLTLGKFQEGWSEYEWRMDPRRTAADRVRAPQLSMPMWQGEDPRGMRILLMPEQGFGDYIQFIRFAKNLKQLGATVLAACRPPVADLMTSCPWIDQVIRDGEQVQYHRWTFPMSLPYRLGLQTSDFSTNMPYLKASSEKIDQWKKWFIDQGYDLTKPIIAINWKGSKTHIRDQFRNIELESLDPILHKVNIQYVGINKEVGALEVYPLPQGHLRNAGAQIVDFSDTAAIIELADLLISVDSAPVHLAGALNKPCWTLVDYLPDFRWQLRKEDTSWYPQMRLYRKQSPKNWDSVLIAIEQSLQERYT